MRFGSAGRPLAGEQLKPPIKTIQVDAKCNPLQAIAPTIITLIAPQITRTILATS